MVLKFLCDCDLQHIVAVGFLSHWAYFTVLRFIFVYVLSLYIVWMHRVVTWWGGPGGIEVYP